MLEQMFQQIVTQDQFWQAQEPVVVATSTGVDSMVLLHLLLKLPPQLKPKIIVAHVNHELRSESDAEEAYLRTFCQQHALTLNVTHWASTEHPSTGVEAAARQFRYTFFETVMNAQHSRLILTAHHGDDQLETMLMKFIRSGEVHEMRGIQVKRSLGSGYLIRPLLAFDKASLRQYAQQQQITYFEDQTNQSLAMLRNRVRHQVVPLLKKENPQVIQNANRLSQALSSLLQAQQQWLASIIALSITTVQAKQLQGDLTGLQALAPDLQKLVWQTIWQQYYPQQPALKAKQLQQMVHLTNQWQKPQGQVRLNQELQLSRVYQQFTIQPVTLAAAKQPVSPVLELTLNQWCSLPNTEQIGVFDLQHLPSQVTAQQIIWLSAADWPLQVQKLVGTDQLLIENGHHKSIRRLFIDLKVPQSIRANYWGVKTDNQLLGHPNLRVSALFNQPQTGKIRYVLCSRQT